MNLLLQWESSLNWSVNYLAPCFREEISLVDQFLLELLVEFIESLMLAHHDEDSVGTVEQCKHAIDHLERIVKQQSAMLLKKSKLRRVPRYVVTLAVMLRTCFLFENDSYIKTIHWKLSKILSFQLSNPNNNVRWTRSNFCGVDAPMTTRRPGKKENDFMTTNTKNPL